MIDKHEIKLRKILSKNIPQSNQSTISKTQRSNSKSKYSNPALDYRHNILQTARGSSENSFTYGNNDLKLVSKFIGSIDGLPNLKTIDRTPQIAINKKKLNKFK